MSQSTILVVEDDSDLQEALCETLELAGLHTIAANDGVMALEIIKSNNIDVVVSDVQMQRMDGHALLKKIKDEYATLPVLLMTAHGNIKRAVEAMHSGAADYLVKPFDADVLVEMVIKHIRSDDNNGDFIAVSQSSLEIKNIAEKVAENDVTVMITGESGTGKEVLAQFVHNHSNRKDKPFIAINCAAIPDNMLEATLFGYEKGAFTGAYKACAGKFELADGGTLLLDEISEMEVGLQAKLLRVLQEREVERLGGNKLIPLDVRVVATSNRDMREEVDAGRFREDLYYRLNVFPLHIQKLSVRKEDIAPIATKLVEKYALKSGRAIPTLSNAALQKLAGYSWPGNVRELDNVIQRAMVLYQGEVIKETEILFEAGANSRLEKTCTDSVTLSPEEKTLTINENTSLGADLQNHEYQKIVSVMKDCMGNRKLASETLGISPRTLRYKLARMRESGMLIPA